MQVNPQEVSGDKATTAAQQVLRPANGKARRYHVKRCDLYQLGSLKEGSDCVCVVPVDDHSYLLNELFAEQRRSRALLAALEHLRDTVEGQLTIIAQRAPGKYLDKAPVVRSLKAHQARCVEALLAYHKQQLAHLRLQDTKREPTPITCEQIQEQMTGDGCPTAGSLGECAAMWRSGNSWTAALYIWDANFNDSTAVAKWFHKLGAVDVFIGHTLYDTNNGDRNGEVPEGGARQWLVEFSTKEVPHA